MYVVIYLLSDVADGVIHVEVVDWYTQVCDVVFSLPHASRWYLIGPGDATHSVCWSVANVFDQFNGSCDMNWATNITRELSLQIHAATCKIFANPTRWSTRVPRPA